MEKILNVWKRRCIIPFFSAQSSGAALSCFGVNLSPTWPKSDYLGILASGLVVPRITRTRVQSEISNRMRTASPVEFTHGTDESGLYHIRCIIFILSQFRRRYRSLIWMVAIAATCCRFHFKCAMLDMLIFGCLFGVIRVKNFTFFPAFFWLKMGWMKSVQACIDQLVGRTGLLAREYRTVLMFRNLNCCALHAP